MHYFMRVAPYANALPQKNMYQVFDLMAQGKYDPAIKPGPISLPPGVSHVHRCFVSPSKRAHGTALSLSLKATKLAALAEIEFSMFQIMPEEEFYALPEETRVNQARQVFFTKLVTTIDLSEPFYRVVLRVRAVLVELLACGGSTLCISHAFFLKVVQVLAKHPTVLERPERFLDYYDGSERAYEFLGGFSLTKAELANLLAKIDTAYGLQGSNGMVE